MYVKFICYSLLRQKVKITFNLKDFKSPKITLPPYYSKEIEIHVSNQMSTEFNDSELLNMKVLDKLLTAINGLKAQQNRVTLVYFQQSIDAVKFNLAALDTFYVQLMQENIRCTFGNKNSELSECLERLDPGQIHSSLISKEAKETSESEQSDYSAPLRKPSKNLKSTKSETPVSVKTNLFVEPRKKRKALRQDVEDYVNINYKVSWAEISQTAFFKNLSPKELAEAKTKRNALKHRDRTRDYRERQAQNQAADTLLQFALATSDPKFKQSTLETEDITNTPNAGRSPT